MLHHVHETEGVGEFEGGIAEETTGEEKVGVKEEHVIFEKKWLKWKTAAGKVKRIANIWTKCREQNIIRACVGYGTVRRWK